MKVSKTYSIEHTLFEKFDEICKRKDINRSQWMEDKVREFVSKEMIIDTNTYWKLRMDDEPTNYVSVKERKDNFVIMSNGNHIDVFDFEKMYEEVDPYVNKVLSSINGETGDMKVKEVQPEILETGLNPEKIKNFFENIDTSRISGDISEESEFIIHHPTDLDEAHKFRDENPERYDKWIDQMNEAMKNLNLPEVEIEKDEYGNITSMKRKNNK